MDADRVQSEARSSWLETDPEAGFTSGRRQSTWWAIKQWWQETTDSVILNSPWLRHGIDRVLRCLWVLAQLPYWYDVGFLSGQDAAAFIYEILIQNPVNCILMIWMTICLIASVYTAVMRQELRASFFLAQGLFLSFRLHSLVAPKAIVTSYDMYIMVALCHCGVHPLALVIPLLYSNFLLVKSIQVDGIDTWTEFAQTGVVEAIDLNLFAAFTWDFTQRVRAVSSGILLGDVTSDDDPALASPAAGRSARRLCWLLVFESFALWHLFLSILRKDRESFERDGLVVPPCVRDNLPVSTFLATSIATLVWLLTVLSKTCKSWKSDLAFAFCVCTPSVMWQFDFTIAARAYSVHGWDGHGWEKTAEFQHLFNRIDISLWLHLTAVMGLVLAGCYPLICVLAVLPFTISSLVALPLHWQVWRYVVRGTYQRWFWVQTVAPVVVSWFLVLTHWVRFSARVKAIREGLEQSHGTAVAASMLLEGIQLPLRLQRSLCLAAVTQGQLTASADSLSQKGLEEVEGLAKELQEAAGGFDLIISSPSASCIETASILAQHFGAEVMVDPLLAREVPEDQVPETQEEPRAYARHFLAYLQHAGRCRGSCVLVTHDRMLQVGARLLPSSMQHRSVVAVDNAAALVALHDGTVLTGAVNENTQRGLKEKLASFLADCRQQQDDELLQCACLNEWKVILQGFHFCNSSQPLSRIDESGMETDLSFRDLQPLAPQGSFYDVDLHRRPSMESLAPTELSRSSSASTTLLHVMSA